LFDQLAKVVVTDSGTRVLASPVALLATRLENEVELLASVEIDVAEGTWLVGELVIADELLADDEVAFGAGGGNPIITMAAFEVVVLVLEPDTIPNPTKTKFVMPVSATVVVLDVFDQVGVEE
jgi:hypothetical protein